jgi:hypothetical protein
LNTPLCFCYTRADNEKKLEKKPILLKRLIRKSHEKKSLTSKNNYIILDKKLMGSRNISAFLEVKKLDSRAAIRNKISGSGFFIGEKSTHSTPRSEARGMLRVDTERRLLPRFKNRGLAPSNVSKKL